MLDRDERNQLNAIASDEKQTQNRRQRAEVLLKVDIGPFGPGLTRRQVLQEIELGASGLTQLIRRALRDGPVETALGKSKKGRTHKHKLSDESESEIAAADATGHFTRAELARTYGVSNTSIGRIVARKNRENDNTR